MPSWRENFISLLKAFLLFQMALGVSALAQAERVKSVHTDGTLELQDGRRLALAGIRLTEESLRMLMSMVADKDIDYEIDGALTTVYPETVEPGYVYVTTHILKLPFDPAREPDLQRMMLNEVLLETGGATVKENLEFQYKDKFRELQIKARTRGEGIWSYEPFGKKKQAAVSAGEQEGTPQNE